MGNKFVVGEYVICILNNRASLTVGKEYKVLSVYDGYDDAELSIQNDHGATYDYHSSRFVEKGEFRAHKIDLILKD